MLSCISPHIGCSIYLMNFNITDTSINKYLVCASAVQSWLPYITRQLTYRLSASWVLTTPKISSIIIILSDNVLRTAAGMRLVRTAFKSSRLLSKLHANSYYRPTPWVRQLGTGSHVALSSASACKNDGNHTHGAQSKHQAVSDVSEERQQVQLPAKITEGPPPEPASGPPWNVPWSATSVFMTFLHYKVAAWLLPAAWQHITGVNFEDIKDNQEMLMVMAALNFVMAATVCSSVWMLAQPHQPLPSHLLKFRWEGKKTLVHGVLAGVAALLSQELMKGVATHFKVGTVAPVILAATKVSLQECHISSCVPALIHLGQRMPRLTCSDHSGKHQFGG